MPDQKRALTTGELAQARTIYANRINYRSVEIHQGKYARWQPDYIAMAPDGNIYFPTPIYLADFSVNTNSMSFMIHELAHVWQIQLGVWLKMRRIFVDGDDYDYGVIDINRALNSYKVEEQASILADYYRLQHGLRAERGSGPLASYVSVVRRAMAS